MSIGAISGDLGAQAAALAIQNGEDERRTGHEERDAAYAVEAHDDAEQVQTLHGEASDLRMQGGFDMAAGFVTAAAKAASPVAGAAMEGMQKAGDDLLAASQKDDDADAAADKAAADQAENAAKDAGERATDATSNINAALDFNRNYQATEAAVAQAALHRA